jgi:hypothetical protein
MRRWAAGGSGTRGWATKIFEIFAVKKTLRTMKLRV